MKSEYVRISREETFFGERGLLESQLSAASLIKRMQVYNRMRKEEMLLKIELKKKLSEMDGMVKWFEKLLPKTNDEEKKDFEKSLQENKSEREKFELEKEIFDIKQKLSSLEH